MTRVSYYSLAVVPIVAGVWGPLQTWLLHWNHSIVDSKEGLEKLVDKIEKIEQKQRELPDWLPSFEPLNIDWEKLREVLNTIEIASIKETMPTGWLLAFAAALSVVLAHFIYQTRAPELVKEYKEKDLVEESNELIRRGEEMTPNWLRESVGYLEDAWQRMGHRHNAWFVVRGLRTIWIPNEIEQFEDALDEEAMKKEKPPEEAPDDWKPKEVIAAQEVQGEDRKRIAIEEGQKARYAIECFTHRTSAWLSGGFYIIGGVLIIFILIRQFSYVLAASPAYDWTWQFLQAISKGWVVSAVAALLLVLIFTGAYYVEESTKRKEV